jgi:hypothetical protein
MSWSRRFDDPIRPPKGKSLGNIVAARGAHVHEATNVPRDIKRVGELELQMKISDVGAMAYLHRDAVSKARKHGWLMRIARDVPQTCLLRPLSNRQGLFGRP